ncbi:UNVERIFIED_CONTAM: hypothetical protein HDU68_011042, partial [Siphonaria sp. JEL0065]
RLFDSILEIVNKGKFRNSDASVTPNLLRIVIQDIGGPFWGTDAGSQTAFVELIRFLGRIRGLIRDCRAVLVVGLRGYLFDGYQDGGGVEKSEKSGWLKAVMYAVDGVLEVESFSGSKRQFSDHFTSEYHGFLHVHKLPTFSTLTPAAFTLLSASDLHSLAFKARRKRFLVEAFRLPPEKDDNTVAGGGKENSRSEGKKASKAIGRSGAGCSSPGHNHGGNTGGNSLLDF